MSGTLLRLPTALARAVAGETCQCDRSRGGGSAFTNAGTASAQLWVHTLCRLPTDGWLATSGLLPAEPAEPEPTPPPVVLDEYGQEQVALW